MILTLTASIMYWSLQQQSSEESELFKPSLQQQSSEEPELSELSDDATPQKTTSDDDEASSSVTIDTASNVATDEDGSSVLMDSVSNLNIEDASPVTTQQVENGNGVAAAGNETVAAQQVENGNGAGAVGNETIAGGDETADTSEVKEN